ncbi:MAG: ATP synthase F1 subunit gamma [Phototrophicales bacterium]|nr:MAG: ATP synthase F1 subunit gamma [Phototrophicales bacterium]RMG76148.1 MAG: ATP synthase F1 subunit gamma [Chloroflexota bacterium]
MPSSREVKNRIRSVKNIGQITRALEAVSASRVRKAQARVLASRAYAYKAMEILMNIQAATASGGALHPLLTTREEVKTIMVVLITSDRGLAGAFNTNIIRTAQRFVQKMGKPVQWVAVGRKGRDALVRAGENIVAEFMNIPDDLRISDISPVSRLAKDAFLSGEVDDVFIAYTDFINTLTQRPAVLGWLPLVPHDIEGFEHIKNFAQVSDTSGNQDYEFEPNPQAIIDEIVPRFTELILYQTYLESKASEHSARMVAMRNASDNASQLADALTLVYNKARQAAITNEILDIVGGAEALQATLDKAAEDILRGYEQAPKISGISGADDLTKIEGIGPKMAAALNSAGITRYAQLAQLSEEQLREIINNAGMRFSPSLPTWARQAEFAANGDWDGLRDYQDKLVAGREA